MTKHVRTCTCVHSLFVYYTVQTGFSEIGQKFTDEKRTLNVSENMREVVEEINCKNVHLELQSL
jgi:hypothetical protein